MGFNILIVDDSSVMRKIIMRNLNQSGIQADQEFEASDGYEALNVCSTHTVHLILCDINMPNMDGTTFIKEVRNRPELNQVKIIMITTEAGVDSVQRAIAAGANGYIAKPFTPGQLAEKIKSVSR